MKDKDSKRAIINEMIEADQVRLIGADGEQVGVVSTPEAIKVAQEASLDLVQIAGDSVPVVCKVMDYGKHLFDLKEKNSIEKTKTNSGQKRNSIWRRRRLSGETTQPDTFPKAGDKAKVTMRFRGREMAHQELGMDLQRVESDLTSIGDVEQFPKGRRQMTMVIAPKKSR